MDTYSNLFILLPEFLLIASGWALCRFTALKRPVWEGVEKLIYFVLFPCLLITSTSKATIDWSKNTTMLLVLATCVIIVACLAYAAKWFIKADPIKYASGIQTTFRFNTYIAFAAAGRLGGSEGIALMAITVACLVPLANALAVLSLAKHSQTKIWKELISNPFIIATLSGLTLNTLGIHLPDLINQTLSRVGRASIPLGLMTVGAGLLWNLNKQDLFLVTYWSSIKLMILPSLSLLFGILSNLDPAQLQNSVLWAAMPTATTSYVLAVRMGGHGPIVSITITLMTLIGSMTIPFWLAMIEPTRIFLGGF